MRSARRTRPSCLLAYGPAPARKRNFSCLSASAFDLSSVPFCWYWFSCSTPSTTTMVAPEWRRQRHAHRESPQRNRRRCDELNALENLEPSLVLTALAVVPHDLILEALHRRIVRRKAFIVGHRPLGFGTDETPLQDVEIGAEAESTRSSLDSPVDVTLVTSSFQARRALPRDHSGSCSHGNLPCHRKQPLPADGSAAAPGSVLVVPRGLRRPPPTRRPWKTAISSDVLVDHVSARRECPGSPARRASGSRALRGRCASRSCLRLRLAPLVYLPGISG